MSSRSTAFSSRQSAQPGYRLREAGKESSKVCSDQYCRRSQPFLNETDQTFYDPRLCRSCVSQLLVKECPHLMSKPASVSFKENTTDSCCKQDQSKFVPENVVGKITSPARSDLQSHKGHLNGGGSTGDKECTQVVVRDGTPITLAKEDEGSDADNSSVPSTNFVWEDNLAPKYDSAISSLKAHINQLKVSEEFKNLLVKVEKVWDQEMHKNCELVAMMREITKAVQKQRSLTRSLNDKAVELEARTKHIEAKLKEIPELFRRLEADKALDVAKKRIKNWHCDEVKPMTNRLAKLKMTSGEGKLLWKIPDFSMRVNEACSGRNEAICSPPFYTSSHGYKMYLKLYLLGKGTGRSSHMSLYYIVTKGEFDKHLQWPFSNKVTFKLIHRDYTKDLVETVHPQVAVNSPRLCDGHTCGCPRFARYSDLMNGGFVVEDAVYIQCLIELTETSNKTTTL